MRYFHPLVLALLANIFIGSASAQDDLLWASTGGGWRAMFADIGYANVFQQAGLMTQNSTRFSGVSTTSGGSWFSTQLFYSPEFYNRTAMAERPEELETFVIEWMNTYLSIASTVDNETLARCNTSELESNENYDPDRDYVSELRDMCWLLVKYDFDWALFIQGMMQAASTEYGDATFVDRIANPENRLDPLQQTDLLIQATLVPVSRVRDGRSLTTTGVYLGYNDEQTKLFTVPLSAAWVVDDTGATFRYGSEDRTDQLQTYLADTSNDFSWDIWEDFYLYPGDYGTIEINNADTVVATQQGAFRAPFGGSNTTTVLQVAAISSAAGGQASPLVATVYTQTFSIGYFKIQEARVETVWRVLAGIAAGLGAGILIGFLTGYFGVSWRCCEKPTSHKVGFCLGIFLGLVVGLLTGLLYGVGSVIVPNIYDDGVGGIYQNSTFDNFAVCTQWPNPCGDLDGFMIDGWFIDNPALVINIAQQQDKQQSTDKTIKAIITNTNTAWNTTFNYAQFLQYYATDFNSGVPPGDFVWAPSYYAPYRSPQIFAEYLDDRGLDALLEPLPGSNMTTALLKGTTVDNPSFGVQAGQPVEILLLNLNENITTFVVGKGAIEEYTQPLANMTRDIAANQELVRRVRDFAG